MNIHFNGSVRGLQSPSRIQQPKFSAQLDDVTFERAQRAMGSDEASFQQQASAQIDMSNWFKGSLSILGEARRLTSLLKPDSAQQDILVAFTFKDATAAQAFYESEQQGKEGRTLQRPKNLWRLAFSLFNILPKTGAVEFVTAKPEGKQIFAQYRYLPTGQAESQANVAVAQQKRA